MDISAHGGDLFVALESLRDWLANVSRKRVLGSVRLVNLYRRFLVEKPEIAVSLGHDPERIPYVDFERIVTQWVAIYRV